MRVLVLAIVIVVTACEVKKNSESSIEERYLKLDTSYTSKEAFNDSICKVAIDSANNRFKRNKFELYVFYDSDSSATPIQLLRRMFRMQTITFAREDFVFKFCYNNAMVTAFENHHRFNPIDSVKVIYDSLLKIGQTQANAKFPGGIEEFKRYITCNLEFPEDVNLSPPYPTVRVSFRVSPTGYPDEIEITKSYSSKYDDAVLKMIKSMPKWIPGQGDYGTYEANHIQWNCTFDPVKKEEDCR